MFISVRLMKLKRVFKWSAGVISGERTRPRVLVSAPRRNELCVVRRNFVGGEEGHDDEGVLASTRGARAPRDVDFARPSGAPAHETVIA
jgi:hypothetical protein